MKNIITKSTISILVLLTYTLPLYAIPVPPEGDDDPLPGAPIDNFYLMLALAAIILGVYFMIPKKSKKNSLKTQ